MERPGPLRDHTVVSCVREYDRLKGGRRTVR